MHYYKFNIGDYHSHTSHLTATEDIVYRRLIDYQFLNECHIPEDIKQAARVIRMSDCLTDVEQVLNEFYTLSEQGWYNNRVFRELDEYHAKSKKASIAGKASAEARKAKRKRDVAKTNGRSTDDEQACNQPITNNHKPTTINKARPKDASEVEEYAKEINFIVDGQSFIDHYDANGWMRGKNKIKNWKACLRTWKGRDNGGKKAEVSSASSAWETLIAKIGSVSQQDYPEFDDPKISKALFSFGSWMEICRATENDLKFKHKPRFIEAYNRSE